ncbi:MAG: FAD-dependent oxidoreductase [Acidimicrobiales bacterium]|nr:MAG: FAD-dependent oxidoreductase [Acidimicrobiales bacterium]
MDERALRTKSLWLDQLAGPLTRRPTLSGDVDVDVAIVGAGYTGLWTAYSLLGSDPSLRVLVVEREMVGFGASGRNGGWCVGELAGGLEGAVAAGGRDAGIRMTRAIIDTVDEVGRVVDAEGIDCGFAKGGVIRLARTVAQVQRQRAEVDEYHHFGFGDEVLRVLDADAATDCLRAPDVHGGVLYGPAARVQPARLVRGLADATERLGATIVEGTAATRIVGGTSGSRARVSTDRGTITADVVVRATEAYTRDLDGLRRDIVPLYSLMVATEPLPDDVWDEIGLRDMETFADDRHMVIYGQRTVDGRLAFGGRGAPYRFGSGIDAATEASSKIHDRIIATLRELVPAAGDAQVTHRWGGVLGVPRDWRPSVGLDRATGLAWAGGYVGEGVAATNLAGRTLADLITGTDSDLVTLPWVGHRSPRREPEPLRWAGINVGLRAAGFIDRYEAKRQRESRAASVLQRIMR